jgi:DNA-binding transcriptional regulator YiaG
MSKLVVALKDTVARLSRKEIRKAVGPLRSEIGRLKVALREASERLERAERAVAAAGRKAARSGPLAPALAEDDETRSMRLTPASIRNNRERLGLTQAELGSLVGVTPVAVYLWESSRSTPRERTRRALLALRKVGRREVRRRLAELTEAGRRPGRERARRGRSAVRRAGPGRRRAGGRTRRSSRRS